MRKARESESISQSNMKSSGYLHLKIALIFKLSIKTYNISENPGHPPGNVINTVLQCIYTLTILVRGNKMLFNITQRYSHSLGGHWSFHFPL